MFKLLFPIVLFSSIFSISLANACALKAQDDVFNFVKCDTDRVKGSFLTRLLRVAFRIDTPPLRIAVIAGIDNYPLFDPLQLKPVVDKDFEILNSLFYDVLDYDIVVNIRNEKVSLKNFNKLFGEYIPGILEDHPRSQVVFAYTGHGALFAGESYILTQDSPRLKIESDDERLAISVVDIAHSFTPTAERAFQFLFLLNSCNGGSIVRERLPFGSSIFDQAAAQVLTAGRTDDVVYQLAEGRGSVLFEVFVEIIRLATRGEQGSSDPLEIASNVADIGADGVVTMSELVGALKPAIQRLEHYNVSPQAGVLTNRRSEGEFMFVTNQSAFDRTLRMTNYRSYRQVFGNSSVEIPANIALRQEFFPEGSRELFVNKDWKLFELSNHGQRICYLESFSVNDLNGRLVFSLPLVPFGDGAKTKLRFVPRQVGVDEDDEGFWYVLDQSVEALAPTVTRMDFIFRRYLGSVSNSYVTRPYSRLKEGLGVRVARLNRDSYDDAINGSWISVESVSTLPPMPLTERLRLMEAGTLLYIYRRLRGLILISGAVGLQTYLFDATEELGDMIISRNRAGALGASAERRDGLNTVWAEDTIVGGRDPEFLELAVGQRELLSGMTSEDWMVLLSAIGAEKGVYRDAISLIGFTGAIQAAERLGCKIRSVNQ